jgi:2-polyprenyl-3-methyl-5-hydroxy-6-metoxy-1,4-benzoquinol methylase
VVGVDIAPGPARLWAQRRGLAAVRVLEPSEARAELAPGSMAAVLCAEVLEHIDDPAELLGFFARLLRPGGTLLVSLPTENRAYRFGRRLAGFHGHYHQHNAATLDALIQREGWARSQARHIPGPGPLSIYLIARYNCPA